MNDSVASDALVMRGSVDDGRQLAVLVTFSLASSTRPVICSPRRTPSRRLRDLDLAQHLANDHLDVLVVDLHALQAVDVLDLAHE